MNAIGIFILTAAVTFMYIAAFLIFKRRKYIFISGMRNRTDEEIKKLEKSGYLKAAGKLYVVTAVLLTIGLLLTVLEIPYGFEIAVGITVLVFIIGYIYIQKYEMKERRKSAYISSVITAFITIGIIGYIISRAFLANELMVLEDDLEITGPYGTEINIESIQEIELLDKLPAINLRTNGYKVGERLMGHFQVEEYGAVTLYIHGGNRPYLLIKHNDSYTLINSKKEEETIDWYEQLKEKI
ncbi:DUF3784 domain-containing protein [Oceanobacillus senegalensis]|uniref:DUF3784 domain-containing protein n=1 Tax=Oceanobacillus senegalensis TaxID=1936063 RepID=UPI000A30CBD3|nr:DUF3784 domain-containing protein [Oceanobacillus senegalensis]